MAGAVAAAGNIQVEVGAASGRRLSEVGELGGSGVRLSRVEDAGEYSVGAEE